MFHDDVLRGKKIVVAGDLYIAILIKDSIYFDNFVTSMQWLLLLPIISKSISISPTEGMEGSYMD